MRITFLLPADNLTGGCRVVAIYARQLRQLGHEVLVVCCAPERLGPRAMARAVLRRDAPALRQHFQPAPGHIALSGVPCKVLERPRAITAADVPDADIIIATWWETAVWMHAMPAAKGKKVHLIQGYEVWLNPAICAPSLTACYACRHCHKLAYSTQRKLADDWATSKADRIRKRLGWDAGILNLPGGKPKGMHWRTFARLQAAHNAHVEQAMAGMTAKLGIAMARLEGIKYNAAQFGQRRNHHRSGCRCCRWRHHHGAGCR